VVGGGDTAMEDANFISKFASKVYLIHRRDKFKASKPMQDRTFKNPKIEIIWDTEVTEILSDASGVNGIVVKNLITGAQTQRPTDGLFYAIGHTPNTRFLGGQLSTDEHGFLITSGTETSIPGVFACGDVQDSYYRQAITAAGSGCQSAIRAERFLEH
jgi:thioredoxin reductase (NADPH)